MVDVHDRATRSRNMAAVRSKNTRPERILRSLLFREGLRYRLHGQNLPGKPDLVFSRYRTVVFVHGCFFHAHNCKYFRWPASNAVFWRDKIIGNRDRDARNVELLKKMGWAVLTVWECEVRRGPKPELIAELTRQIRGRDRSPET